MSYHVIDISRDIPEDWEDESKYPNKVLDYVTPEKDYTLTIYPIKRNDDGHAEYDYSQPPQKKCIRMIFELWTYDDPRNNITGKGTMTFVKCPVCGSYHISKEQYDTLCPEMLAGAVGIRYTCKDCGFSAKEDQIVS